MREEVYVLRRGAVYQAIILIFFLLSVCLCPFEAKAQHHRSLFASYKETLFHSGNGMLSDEANAVAQSHDGYLWIGSYAGLMRYNGQAFQQMKDENNQAIVRVSCLFEDSRQRLWIGTVDENLYCSENGIIRKKEEISATNQKAIVEDRDGRIYIAAANGVAVYNEKARIPQHWIEDPRLQHHMVVSLAAEDIGRIWGVTYDGDVFLLDDQRVIAYFDKRYFNGYHPKHVFCDKDGIVYLTTAGNAILRLDTYVNQYTDGEDLRIRTFMTGELEDHRCLYQDQAGRLLVCARNGLGFFDRDMVFHKVEGGLFESSVEQIMQDNYGGYWLASSSSGALHIARTRFTDISAMAMLPEVTYNAVIKYQGALYMGADNGLHILDSSYNVIRNPLTRMLRGTRVRYFAEDADHNLWIATYRKFGLIRYKNGQWQKWGVAEGMPTNMIRTLLVRKNGDIAVGTGDGLVIMRNNAIHRIYDRDTSAIENGVILSLCEDPQGNLFIGSDGDGIYKLEKDNTIQAIPMADDGHRLGSVLSMKWDTRKNGIWINNGRGVYFMQDEVIHKIDTGTLNVSNLLEVTPSADHLMEEKLYLFSSQIAQSVEVAELLDPKVEKNEKMKSYRSITYDNTLDSSLTMGACHFYAPEEQKLYLACSRNVLTLDELKNWEGAVQPRAMIDSIQIRMPDGTVSNMSYNEEIIIPQDFSQLDITFGILSFANVNSDLYYYLEGYDTKPIHVEGKQNHEMHYSTLPGGKYVFHVMAKGRDNSYQNEMSASFEKPKKLAEETWARILFVLVGGWVLIRLTYLYAKKRNEKKLAEAKKEAETANHIAELEAKHAKAEQERANAEAERAKAEEARADAEARRAKAEQERAEAAEARRRLEEDFTERTILTISNTIDAKDKSTNGHSRRVAQYTVEIGKMEGLSTDELRELYYAALLHDIGKIAIPDNILNKPSKLTDEEYGVIKSHTSRGANILNQIKNQRLADGAHYHHERYDGKGYPEKLAGEAIPAYGRMIAVADVVDAMYSQRVYKQGINMDVVIAELKRCSGTQLDPKYAADMVRILENGFVADENRETVFDRE
jgi:energy-coupling factor transport system substrate-specific component